MNLDRGLLGGEGFETSEMGSTDPSFLQMVCYQDSGVISRLGEICEFSKFRSTEMKVGIRS